MTHDAETVERVAAAMWESRNATKWSEAVNQDLIAIYRGLARATLDAMQPTVAEAAKVLLESLHENTQDNWKVVWSAMKEDALEMDMPAAFSEALRAIAGEDKA